MQITGFSLFTARMSGALLAALAALGMSAPGFAQGVETIDPNAGIDSDLAAPVSSPTPTSTPSPTPSPLPQSAPAEQASPGFEQPVGTAPSADASDAASEAASDPQTAAESDATYKKDDLIGAAEGVFGKGAEGLARMIESLLDEQGEPNGYIVGREGGGAIIFGLRYGSGTLYHKIEGQKPVYWTGPSVGFDVGANAGNTFVLVYNLYDTEDLYTRFPAAEGQAYVVGGFTASYLRVKDIVLIPIRMGVGLRLGVNAGYMKFRKTQKWIPF
ncbi:MAG: DUF1134 domain-containing protein [Novosphingobium sp.]